MKYLKLVFVFMLLVFSVNTLYSQLNYDMSYKYKKDSLIKLYKKNYHIDFDKAMGIFEKFNNKDSLVILKNLSKNEKLFPVYRTDTNGSTTIFLFDSIGNNYRRTIDTISKNWSIRISYLYYINHYILNFKDTFLMFNRHNYQKYPIVLIEAFPKYFITFDKNGTLTDYAETNPNDDDFLFYTSYYSSGFPYRIEKLTKEDSLIRSFEIINNYIYTEICSYDIKGNRKIKNGAYIRYLNRHSGKMTSRLNYFYYYKDGIRVYSSNYSYGIFNRAWVEVFDQTDYQVSYAYSFPNKITYIRYTYIDSDCKKGHTIIIKHGKINREIFTIHCKNEEYKTTVLYFNRKHEVKRKVVEY